MGFVEVVETIKFQKVLEMVIVLLFLINLFSRYDHFLLPVDRTDKYLLFQKQSSNGWVLKRSRTILRIIEQTLVYPFVSMLSYFSPIAVVSTVVSHTSGCRCPGVGGDALSDLADRASVSHFQLPDARL